MGGKPFIDLFSLKNLQTKEERKLRRKASKQAKQASKDTIITDSNNQQEERDAAREEQRSQEGNFLWKKNNLIGFFCCKLGSNIHFTLRLHSMVVVLNHQYGFLFFVYI